MSPHVTRLLPEDASTDTRPARRLRLPSARSLLQPGSDPGQRRLLQHRLTLGAPAPPPRPGGAAIQDPLTVSGETPAGEGQHHRSQDCGRRRLGVLREDASCSDLGSELGETFRPHRRHDKALKKACFKVFYIFF